MAPVFIMLVGLPGSGKSTYAEKLSQSGYKTFSSDELRIELLGDVNDVSNNRLIFDTLHKRLTESLKEGNNSIFDATNMSSKGRTRFLESIKDIECTKRCVVFDVPVEVCIERNKNRDRKVPEAVFENMLSYYTPPSIEEGWDEIEMIH